MIATLSDGFYTMHTLGQLMPILVPLLCCLAKTETAEQSLTARPMEERTTVTILMILGRSPSRNLFVSRIVEFLNLPDATNVVRMSANHVDG
jgi:hypothetical protein